MWPWAEVVRKRMPAQEQAASASCIAVGDAVAHCPCLLSVRQARMREARNQLNWSSAPSPFMFACLLPHPFPRRACPRW